MGQSCVLTCTVGDLSLDTLFSKDGGASIGGCGGYYCNPAQVTENVGTKEVFMTISPLAFTDSGVYSCSHNGATLTATVAVQCKLIIHLKLRCVICLHRYFHYFVNCYSFTKTVTEVRLTVQYQIAKIELPPTFRLIRYYLFCIGLNVPFNTFQVISGRCVLVT